MDSDLKGRELLEMFLELSQANNSETKELIQGWIREFNLNEETLSLDDLRLLATCYLESVSADLIHSSDDAPYFMLPQA